jgi:hypothetical protein
MPASTDDILTAVKNIVTALNTSVQTSINLAGAQDFFNITSATLIKSGAGRLVNITLVAAGSADGSIYDATSVTDTSRKIYPILHTGTVTQIANQPFQYGLLVVPGSGMTVAGSFS